MITRFAAYILRTRLAALESRHFADQQALTQAEQQITQRDGTIETLRELLALGRREQNRLATERDNALTEVQRLSDDRRRRRDADRFWITRQTTPHICNN